MNLLNAEAAAKKALKETIEVLNSEVLKKYGTLTAKDVRQLVVDCKWFSAISQHVSEEVNSLSQALVARLKEIANRYDTPLPAFTAEVKTLSARVEEHLKRMGVSWE